MKRIILTLALALTAFAASSGQTKRMAVIGFSESYLREQPDYTAELGTQALMGTVVEIIAEEGYWKQVGHNMCSLRGRPFRRGSGR